MWALSLLYLGPVWVLCGFHIAPGWAANWDPCGYVRRSLVGPRWDKCELHDGLILVPFGLHLGYIVVICGLNMAVYRII